MQVAFIYSQKKFSSKLTKFFTGSTCYHCGLTDGLYFWDMNLLMRRRYWDGLYKDVVLVDTPVPLSREDVEHIMTMSRDRYSALDYLFFALRPIYHFFGMSTRNAGGKICSELVADILNSKGWGVNFAEVPSPADLEVALLGKKDYINCSVIKKA